MRAQDEAEYAELVAAVTHRVHRMAYAVCGDRQLAEDAVQSVLVSAYRTWPRVRDAVIVLEAAVELAHQPDRVAELDGLARHRGPQRVGAEDVEVEGLTDPWTELVVTAGSSSGVARAPGACIARRRSDAIPVRHASDGNAARCVHGVRDTRGTSGGDH